MSGYRITYTDGTEELTPEGTDLLRSDPDGIMLHALQRFGTRPPVVLETYVLANIRKWKPLDR